MATYLTAIKAFPNLDAMTTPAIKPNHKAIKAYYEALQAYERQEVQHETALRSAFQNLLEQLGRQFGWTLIPELSDKAAGKAIRPDGTFRDDYYITRGHWEAKDSHDHLETEIKKKIAKGYPTGNIIFEDTRQAQLYQNGERAMVVDLTDARQLADLLNAFFAYTEPAHENFGKAIDEFKERVPDLALGLVEKIKAAHTDNPKFIAAFAAFYELCCNSLNPNLSQAAVDEMLVQHLLTERLIRTIFDNQDFTRRNVIAAEIEKVIDALVSKSFNRHDFLKSLDRFYLAIESAAATIESFAEKQHFLNSVYERFFQGYSVKVADTHGIVYTPQEIVDFMCASVAEVLQSEFGKTLGDKDVYMLDPCTGTGNFIVNLLRRIPKRDLPRMYRQQLFANEVMLLPYYIAALNIEHAYYELTGSYEPFGGLCFVDTLDLAKGQQNTFGFMSEENVQRVAHETEAPITVVIANPPYNANIRRTMSATQRERQQQEPQVRSDRPAGERDVCQGLGGHEQERAFRHVREVLPLGSGPARRARRDRVLRLQQQLCRPDRLRRDAEALAAGLHASLPFAPGRQCSAQSDARGNRVQRLRHPGWRGDHGGGREPRRHGSHELATFTGSIRLCGGTQNLRGWRSTRAWPASSGRRLQPDERHTWLVPQNASEFARFVPLGTRRARLRRAAARGGFQAYIHWASKTQPRRAWSTISIAACLRTACSDVCRKTTTPRSTATSGAGGKGEYRTISCATRRSNGARPSKANLREDEYAEFDE